MLFIIFITTNVTGKEDRDNTEIEIHGEELLDFKPFLYLIKTEQFLIFS